MSWLRVCVNIVARQVVGWCLLGLGTFLCWDLIEEIGWPSWVLIGAFALGLLLLGVAGEMCDGIYEGMR